jgi:hypothetical protein
VEDDFSPVAAVPQATSAVRTRSAASDLRQFFAIPISTAPVAGTCISHTPSMSHLVGALGCDKFGIAARAGSSFRHVFLAATAISAEQPGEGRRGAAESAGLGRRDQA